MYGDDFEDALNNLKAVLFIFMETNIPLSDEKCFMMLSEGIVLGHHVSPARLKVNLFKIEIILKFPIPSNQRDVISFLGYAGYYRRFVEKFSKIAFPLFKLLVKDAKFCWDTNYQFTFQTLKEKLLPAPILRGLDWILPFTYLHMHLI